MSSLSFNDTHLVEAADDVDVPVRGQFDEPQSPLQQPYFNPDAHLNYSAPARVMTMEEIGLPNSPLSNFAVSEPFQLFSLDAIQCMRQEIFQPEVLQNYQFSSDLAQCQLRGYAAHTAPFTLAAWQHPSVLSIISQIAGIELIPEMDYEVGHINLSSKATATPLQSPETVPNPAAQFAKSTQPIVDWHTDSYPFVCVTMLSDCTNMKGGETALKTGRGDIIKIRGPQMGCAIVLQGRYIEHQALASFGGVERITSVTSFRPKCPLYRDDTVLTTVRPVSNLSELYFQFSDYRLEILEARIRNKRTLMRESRNKNQAFSTSDMKAFLEEQQEFLAHTNSEIVPAELIVPGRTRKQEAIRGSQQDRPYGSGLSVTNDKAENHIAKSIQSHESATSHGSAQDHEVYAKQMQSDAGHKEARKSHNIGRFRRIWARLSCRFAVRRRQDEEDARL